MAPKWDGRTEISPSHSRWDVEVSLQGKNYGVYKDTAQTVLDKYWVKKPPAWMASLEGDVAEDSVGKGDQHKIKTEQVQEAVVSPLLTQNLH